MFYYASFLFYIYHSVLLDTTSTYYCAPLTVGNECETKQYVTRSNRKCPVAIYDYLTSPSLYNKINSSKRRYIFPTIDYIVYIVYIVYSIVYIVLLYIYIVLYIYIYSIVYIVYIVHHI